MRPIEGYTYIPTIAEVVILAGVLSAVILAFILVSRYFPIFEETETHEVGAYTQQVIT